MLTQLTVKNLAIVEFLELDFAQGMHVITGETGAGKSIIIDALSIALGERASAEQIRAGQTQAEVTACFDISRQPIVQKLLREQELPAEECVIRRIITTDGRSRAYINGQSVAAQQIKSIAPYLVQIHSQHQHHALLEADYQRQLLDAYANHPELVKNVADLYAQYASIKRQIEELSDIQQQADRLTLLNYQIQELETLNIQPNELASLDQKHTALAKGQELLATSQKVCNLLVAGEDNATSCIADQLHAAASDVQALAKIEPALVPCLEMLQQAIVLVQEAHGSLAQYANTLDLDPSQLEAVERRLSTIHALARKLKAAPEFLPTLQEELTSQRAALTNASEHLEQLQQQLQQVEALYKHAAAKLTASRTGAANKLTAQVEQQIRTLGMPHAVFAIECLPIKHAEPSPHGSENIQFTVSTNPGQPTGLLKKVASGGELSRISLAIQVIAARQTAVPTLILDEVDVGISGKTAAIVGALMRALGATAQILCITHLPQVAAQGHFHFKVEKRQTATDTSTVIAALSQTQRVEELARLVGGTAVTREALAHAESLLTEVSLTN